MTRSPGSAGRFLGPLLAGLLSAAAVVYLMLPAQAERLRRGLPAPVAVAGANETLHERIRAAEETAAAEPSLENVAALGRLYHANGFSDAAARCWQLLAQEDKTAGRWPHYLAQLARIRSDQATIARELARATARSPGYSPAWLQRADLAFKNSQYAEARTAYERRLQLEPDDPYARLGLARLDLIDLERDDAADRLLAIVADHPTFAAAHNLYAQLAAENGQVDDARRHRWLGNQAGRFEQAPDPWMQEIEAQCFDPGRLRILGVRDYQNKRIATARGHFERAIAIEPRDPDGYAPLCSLYRDLQEFELAEQAMRTAKGLYEENGDTVPIDVFIQLGQIQMDTARADAAVRLLREGLELHPRSFELLNSLGVALRQVDQVEDSIASFRRALEINPFDADTNFNLAFLLFNRGARDEALELHRRALKLKPTFAPSLSFLAQHEIAAGRLEAALPFVQRLDEAYGMVPEARRIVATWHLAYGDQLRRNGENVQAIAAFEKAFAVDPNLPPLARLLGNHYLDQGDFARARAPLETYHQQASDDPASAMLLAQVYAREGQFRRARELLTAAATLAQGQGNEELAAFCQQILAQLPRR